MVPTLDDANKTVDTKSQVSLICIICSIYYSTVVVTPLSQPDIRVNTGSII